MRKIILCLFVAVFMMTACSNQETTESAQLIPTGVNTQSNTRSYEEALKIAENAIDMLESSKSSTRSEAKSRKIDFTQNKVIMHDTKTRGDSIISDSLIYVFNFENNEGFALVSASVNADPLLAVTEKGFFDPEVPSNIDGLNLFVEQAKEYVLSEELASLNSVYETKDSIVGVSPYSEVGPFVSVKWGQNYAEGEFCDNGLAGCANTAMAQIFTYYGQPSSLSLTYCNGGTISLNWPSIRSHGTKHYSSYCSNLTVHTSISHLLRELGERNNSSYVSVDENHIYTITDLITDNTAINTLNGLGYQHGSWNPYIGSFVRNQLDNHHLFIASALSHFWVLDGYMLGVVTHNIMYKIGDNWYYSGNTYTTTSYFNHYNWGFYGDSDGYFNENVYNTQQVSLLDNGCTNYEILVENPNNVSLMSIYY